MLELRILSGLHRGATLPLDEDTVTIGSDESADVVLLDPGIEANHASLRQTGKGWTVLPLDGDVLGSDTNEALKSLELAPGDYCRIGRIWVMVVDSDADWNDPPQEPVDIGSDDLLGDDDEQLNLRPDEVAQDMQSTPESAPSESGDAQQDSAGEKTDDEAPQAAGVAKRKKSAIVLPLIICAIALAAGGAYQLVGGDAETVPLKPGVPRAGTVQAPKPVELTQEELRAAFRKRLAEVDLLKSFDLKLKDNAWSMQATLDDEEAARFERTLAAFVNQHKILFPITAKVGSAEHMLPFKIRQVISGANASVITLDGNRLYVGDEHMGLRLVSIKDSRLTFMGKRKIEVRW